MYVTFRDVHKKTNEHINLPHTRNEAISTDFDHETNHSLSPQVCSVIPPQNLHNQNLDYFAGAPSVLLSYFRLIQLCVVDFIMT